MWEAEGAIVNSQLGNAVKMESSKWKYKTYSAGYETVIGSLALKNRSIRCRQQLGEVLAWPVLTGENNNTGECPKMGFICNLDDHWNLSFVSAGFLCWLLRKAGVCTLKTMPRSSPKTPLEVWRRWDRDPPVNPLGFRQDGVGKAAQSLSREIQNGNDQMCSQGSGEVIEKRYRQPWITNCLEGVIKIPQ